eukprot:GHVU01120163.1.p1 GENE.GHVU01120163.1~~GHVU01120163.1.p1  ORF type:complete len:230 (+),score=16.13 GHVU01120163.1:100-789(+)
MAEFFVEVISPEPGRFRLIARNSGVQGQPLVDLYATVLKRGENLPDDYAVRVDVPISLSLPPGNAVLVGAALSAAMAYPQLQDAIHLRIQPTGQEIEDMVPYMLCCSRKPVGLVPEYTGKAFLPMGPGRPPAVPSRGRTTARQEEERALGKQLSKGLKAHAKAAESEICLLKETSQQVQSLSASLQNIKEALGVSRHELTGKLSTVSWFTIVGVSHRYALLMPHRLSTS